MDEDDESDELLEMELMRGRIDVSSLFWLTRCMGREIAIAQELPCLRTTDRWIEWETG